MGFTISNYSLMGIPLQNVYVSIKGRYSILNNNFIYGIPNKYQIYADYWFSIGAGQPSAAVSTGDVAVPLRVEPNTRAPTIQGSSITINTDQLPANIYATIYEGIKKNIDLNESLNFIDD